MSQSIRSSGRRSGWVIGLVLGLWILGTGCQEHAPQPRQTPAQLHSRLDSAKLISDQNTRDKALHDVAIDAGASRVGDVAVLAVSSITDPGVKDDAAEKTGKILDERADRPNAEKVVKQMSDVARRDQMLAYLASRAPASR